MSANTMINDTEIGPVCPVCYHPAENGECTHCVSSPGSVMAGRLDSLLPELEYSRGTHIQWRDAPSKWHEENPDIGDRDFHVECIAAYDKRIETIKDAAKMLRSFSQNIEDSRAKGVG